ncbi:hypothetical protein [Mycoplasma sp. ATU-Cv-508]|uniref:hypothetical protein n=1 Tax=Mycoplasma sp. ATU-Cv-508 TaxID=2048001 RepID=UPI0011E4DD50
MKKSGRKLVLLTASSGLFSLPVAGIIACSNVWGDDQGKKLEKDDQDKKIGVIKNFYYTSLKEFDTLNFNVGETYSPSQIGVQDIFNDQYLFKVDDYDDLQGALTVSVEHVNDQAVEQLKSGVEIRGFKNLNAQEFFSKNYQRLTRQ